jgi:hypothetical protein
MDERIVRDIAEVLNVGLEAPVPVVLEEKFVVIEFPVNVSLDLLVAKMDLP